MDFIDSYISHDELVLANYVIREYDDQIEENWRKCKESNRSSNILIYL